jgi:hypothetical protein
MTSDPKRLGDAPIEAQYKAQMNAIARTIDEFINSDGKKKNGFILMMFPFEGHEGRCNYMSNAERKDVITLLKEQLARFQGQPEAKGRA